MQITSPDTTAIAIRYARAFAPRTDALEERVTSLELLINARFQVDQYVHAEKRHPDHGRRAVQLPGDRATPLAKRTKVAATKSGARRRMARRGGPCST